MKGLVNIKNSDNKCFFCYHIRLLNPLKIHPKKITKTDKNIVNDLDYKNQIQKKIITRLSKRVTFAPMYFVMKTIQFILFMYQIKNLEATWIY